ncbi:uncharacterized protein C8Q71DRAFT_857842 [Rhodofomes roseus]|uniref:Mediator of RNA polymerase II transcription subunit 9 n=1 Tax=Rhodofomes roseus TaxID=34475 RepID=A0ABQ8KFR2_9APHY|nr:uncharacterized protein C8Q71DRAFT_857842 [Rhodofomes roseus]KAH9836621.1 hypothetical protein C8Q71DRAFT_857842 [Rhodofomes roseus]
MSTVYESLLPKLVAILEVTQQAADSPPTQQVKQALVHVTNDFKETLRQAKDMASTLPGGELSVEEQGEVIAMLEKLKERKQQQLAKFSADVDAITKATTQMRMEVDSTASTPAV